jgi:hypothetical protein
LVRFPVPSTKAIALAAACAGATLTGCGQVDDRPAEWAFISPAIFQPNCATTSCHSPAAAVSGLDFSTADNGYASLTRLWVYVVVPPDAGSQGLQSCGVESDTKVCLQQIRPLVTPYDPAGSRVVNMLRARDAPRMPPDRPLPEADIRLVERWVLNGATYPGFQLGDAGQDAAMDAHHADGHPSDGHPADGHMSDGAQADGHGQTDGAGHDGRVD